MRRSFQVYANTPENAARIGWDKLPEQCLGDPALPYVRHDIGAGIGGVDLFLFVKGY